MDQKAYIAFSSCVGSSNCYLVKRRENGGAQFSRDPLNLLNKHSYKASHSPLGDDERERESCWGSEANNYGHFSSTMALARTRCDSARQEDCVSRPCFELLVTEDGGFCRLSALCPT